LADAPAERGGIRRTCIGGKRCCRDRLLRWILELYGRKGYYKTLIAIANKHARVRWAMLAEDEHYDTAAWQRHPMAQPPLAGNA
jgi:hypothetical protein